MMASLDPDERHRQAVANTLQWADQAAEVGDFAAALGWLTMLESIGDELPDAYRSKRAAWRGAGGQAALAEGRVGGGAQDQRTGYGQAQQPSP